MPSTSEDASADNNVILFEVGICPLYPGQKIVAGDRRHTRYHGSFKTETHTPKSFLEAISKGFAFCSALITGDCGREHHAQRFCCKERRDRGDTTHCGRPARYRISHHYESSQVMALDYDTGNLSMEELLANYPFIAAYATFIYPTISWTLDNRKWRPVFILNEPITDSQVYRKAATALLGHHETSDQMVKDPCRCFFGQKPGNSEAVFLGNLLPMGEVLELVVEYEDRRRDFDQRAKGRDLPSVAPASVTGEVPDEKYVSRTILEELAYLSSRTPGSGERYPSIIPAAMSLGSLRLSEWLSVEARAQINVEQLILEGCARNGALEHYGEAHLLKAINWGIAHAEPRPPPSDWGQRRRPGPPRQRPIRNGKHRRGYLPVLEVPL